MDEKTARPVSPVAPDGMEMLFFYKCPRCSRHTAVTNPTDPRMITCEACRLAYPIIPVDEHALHYIRIMMAGGKGAADPDFM